MEQPELTIVALTVDPALVPAWFDEIKAAAIAAKCTRMAVLEDPAGWKVRIELPAPNRDALKRDLAARWARFQAADG